MQKPIKLEIECHPAAIMVIGVIVAKAMDGDTSLAEILPEGKKEDILNLLADLTIQASKKIDYKRVTPEEMKVISELSDIDPVIRKWKEVLLGGDDNNIDLFVI